MRIVLLVTSAAVGSLCFGVAPVSGAGSNLAPMTASSHLPMVTVRLLDATGRLTDPLAVPEVVKPDEAWRAQLTPEQYRITRAHGTERAFCGRFHDHHKPGIYACIGCGLPLFRSDAKFDSGTGWPSFFQPLAKENLGQTRDTSFGMVRTEVHCLRCKAHLGHVFPDGPRPTGLRYCINSDALSFHERPPAPGARAKLLLGGGQVPELRQALSQVKGVSATRLGHVGGHVCPAGAKPDDRPRVLEVEYDPAQVAVEQLLEVFWAKHDPFASRGAGTEDGGSAGTAIFFTTPEQETAARLAAARLEARRPGQKVGTDILLAPMFHPEEPSSRR